MSDEFSAADLKFKGLTTAFFTAGKPAELYVKVTYPAVPLENLVDQEGNPVAVELKRALAEMRKEGQTP